MLYKSYEEIINCKHHISYKRPHMSKQMRAAQFAPFAALTGYEAVVKETARLTEQYRELDECEKEQISRVLNEVYERLKKGESPCVDITYFKKDARKSGGEYVTDICKIKRLDLYKSALITQAGDEIKFENLLLIGFGDMEERESF